MIRYQFFPRSRGVTREIQDVIDCFKAVENEIDSSTKTLVSNDVLAIVRPYIEKHGYKVEKGKSNEEKIDGVIKGINDLVTLGDPLSKVQLKKELDSDLVLTRISCPIGVIGVIFESRPDALVQISTLCIKSGNSVILKGGREAANTNKALFEIIKEAAVSVGIPADSLFLVQAREDIQRLLACHEYVDLLIPRGSNEFVQYIMNNTKIPVMGHADGICHIYADKELDTDMAVKIIIDSKTQYTAVCNATETLLVHKDVAPALLPKLNQAFKEKNVLVKGTEDVKGIIDCEDATEEDFKTEYLDLIISVKLVSSVREAIDHINKYGSHHTDCIITTNDETASEFEKFVDSALHARGPVGLEGLVTYKYILEGNGNIVDDYVKGKRNFNFKEL